MIRLFAALLVATPAAAADYDCVIRPASIATVSSSVAGIVTERAVEVGDLVALDDKVLQLDDRPERLALEAARLGAQSQTELASRDLALKYQTEVTERLSSLAQRSLAPVSDATRAEMERGLAELARERAAEEQALSQIRLARARTELERRRIASPITGFVTALFVEQGEAIGEMAEIATIADISELKIEAYLPISAYSTVEVGASAIVAITQPFEVSKSATVTRVERVFDAASGTFGVSLMLPNEDFALPAGLRCTLTFGASG